MSEETTTAIVAPVQGEIEALQTRVQELETQLQAVQGRLPNTWLLSDNLLKRAFGVYGHYLLAGLIIAVPIMACSFFMFFVMAMMAAIFGEGYAY
ncbi:MAG: hypothetical protein K1X65_14695 [Caldilineales bacterium]|nr:hypothetical protein [Caldilineales bacterium]MCW5857525.1 hypothetical protein [Caldilineales bacterium]